MGKELYYELEDNNILIKNIYASPLTRAFTTCICMMKEYDNLISENIKDRSNYEELNILFGHGDFINGMFKEMYNNDDTLSKKQIKK